MESNQRLFIFPRMRNAEVTVDDTEFIEIQPPTTALCAKSAAAILNERRTLHEPDGTRRLRARLLTHQGCLAELQLLRAGRSRGHGASGNGLSIFMDKKSCIRMSK